MLRWQASCGDQTLILSLLLRRRGTVNRVILQSDSEGVPTGFPPFGGVQGLALLYASHSFKPWLFVCAQFLRNLFQVLPYFPSPLPFTASGVGAPFLTCLLLISSHSVFCYAEAVQSAFSSSGGIVL